MATRWEQRGKQLADCLKNTTTEEAISHQCKLVIDEINKNYESVNSKKNPLSDVRRIVKSVFPDTSKQEFSYQHFTNSGKGKIERWEHLALKYLTLSSNDWDLLGDDNRKNFTESKIETINTETKTMITTVEKPSFEDYLNQFRMLPLGDDEKYGDQTIEDAINATGKSAEDFIKTALLAYSRSVLGKSRNDLSIVSTHDLMTSPTYLTAQGRAEEIVKRAIRAIKIYNDEIATEPSDRWAITQSALAELTKARPSSIKETLINYQDDLHSYHEKHEMLKYNEKEQCWELKSTINRKRGKEIKDVINLVELVPDGLE